MPKRRRLLTPIKNRAKQASNAHKDELLKSAKEVSVARGRLKGALKEVLEPIGEESDNSADHTPVKRERYYSQDYRKESEDDDRTRRKSPLRQSYVLKLFDRSVDLSQFEEDSPLYPICRAWMINQPKANYKDFGQVYEEPEITDDSVELPGPEGPPISRIPELLPEQKACSKDNINLNYRAAPPPPRAQLLRGLGARWAAVRGAWLARGARVEARYERTQQLLNKINVNAL